MKIVLLFFCFLPIAAAACNQPIIKNGSCPLGYYSSGGYCIPSR
jgi:hypothetical protein